MRVAMLAPISWRVPPRHYGGWEQATSTLTEGLVTAGIDVTLFASGDSLTTARLSSVCPQPLSESPTLDARVYETLHAVACFERAEEFDVIHNHAGALPVCCSRLVPAPVITTLHGSAAEAASQVIYRKYRTNPYISITDAERALLPELNYISTIYHGVEVQRFPFAGERGGYLLYVGRIARVKGVHVAIEVAKRSGLPLVLAGIVPKEEEAYFAAEVAPHLNHRDIRFVGPAEHGRRNTLYAGARAVLHLVEYHEAFGLTMIEAMACGTPVIATARGSVPEVVAHRRTGFIVRSVDEAVEAVRALPSISREACRVWVAKRFSAARMVEEHVRVYTRLAAPRTRSAVLIPAAT